MAGAQQLQVELLDPVERIEVGRERAAVGRHERRALAEDQIAGEADAVQQEAHVILGVAGRGHHLERPGLHHRRVEHRQRRRVVAVGMGQEDAPEPAATLGLVAQCGDVIGVLGARIDDVGGVGADHIAVGALEGHRARVRRDEAGDLGVSRGGVDDRSRG